MKILITAAVIPSLIYVLAGVLPAVFLMVYVYRQDRVEHEPVRLLLSLLSQGINAALLSIVLGTVVRRLLGLVVPDGTRLYTVLYAFLAVAAVEEGAKFYFLKRRTWSDPNFNYRFDAVVYAVFVSLGFAAFENILYVFQYGLSVVIPRALLSIPGHMAFSVYMGVYYGRAKLQENYGFTSASKASCKQAYLWAVLLHGFYDACLMIGTRWTTAVFLVFVVITYTRMFRRLRREAAQDTLV